MRKSLIAAVVAGLLLASVSPAGAHFRRHADANDASFDDLGAVEISTFRQNGHRMMLADASFLAGPLYDDCCYELWFWFDSRGDGRADLQLHLAFDRASGGLFFVQFAKADGTPIDAYLRGVTRIGDGVEAISDIPVWFRFRVLRATKHVRWYVSTGTDRAPDAGWFQH